MRNIVLDRDLTSGLWYISPLSRQDFTPDPVCPRLTMAPLSLVLLASVISLCSAAPAAEVLPRASPVKMTLQKHVLADGAKPRNRARLLKGKDGLAARASSEGLQDYYLGTDLQ